VLRHDRFQAQFHLGLGRGAGCRQVFDPIAVKNVMIEPRPRLQTLIFEITQRCNHACLHCYNVWQPDTPDWPCDYPRGELDTAQTLALIAKALDETRCEHVTLTGGEPLLRDDLAQILDMLRNRGVRVTLISNGRLLTELAVVDLVGRGVSLFELPLFSRRRAVHDDLCASPGAFDAVLAAMARIRYHRGAFVAVFVATRRNIPDLYDTIKLAFAFGARAVMLNRFNVGGRGRAHLADLLPTVEEMRQALAVANEASAEFGLPIACSIALQPCLIDLDAYPNLHFGFCAAGTERAYYTVDPLGNVRPCNHTPTILGNLFEEGLAALTAPDRLSAFMQAVPPFCAPCSMRDTCQGGCKAAAQVCYGSLGAEEPFLHHNRECARPRR
jgi:radical SAM protein with 4Fe4S-binding SPASM domain